MTGLAPRATLSAVARRAGVSVATASKVLNGRSGVSDDTRNRVHDTMMALGYRPTTARADDPGTNVHRINVILTSVADTMYVPEILNAMLVAADGLNMEIIPRLLTHTLADGAAEVWARSLLGGGCQGAVIIAADLSDEQIGACERMGVPLLGIDCYTSDDAGLVSVGSNNFAGGYSAARHLIGLGHRRIGLIRGPERVPFARERAYGFMAALGEEGIELPDELVVERPFNYDGGLSAGRQMLTRAGRPSAIAANCDGGAIGVMEAARELGLRVPDDLSVVGFDDTKLAAWSTPQLTTVNQPLADIAGMALRMMSRMIAGLAPDSPHVQLATRLVPRGSTAAPAG